MEVYDCAHVNMHTVALRVCVLKSLYMHRLSIAFHLHESPS